MIRNTNKIVGNMGCEEKYQNGALIPSRIEEMKAVRTEKIFFKILKNNKRTPAASSGVINNVPGKVMIFPINPKITINPTKPMGTR